MTHDGFFILDEDRDEIRGNMPPPFSGKDIKGMFKNVENYWPIGDEAINQD